jgi:uncharacterized protein (UPF0332 family)
VRPESEHFIENARNMLARGQRMLEADLHEDAGRAAYLAAFHAAQALICEREHRSLKTHQGVQSEFARLIKADCRGVLSRAYAFKTIADYDPLTAVPPTEEDVRLALQAAIRFVDEIARIANP